MNKAPFIVAIALWLGYVAVSLSVTGLLIYVAYHFISKLW